MRVEAAAAAAAAAVAAAAATAGRVPIRSYDFVDRLGELEFVLDRLE
jgi:hypothetical protein